MADRVVPVDVRAAIVTWPEDAPRGAVSRFVREHGISRSQFYEIRNRARLEGPVAAMQPRPRVVRMVRHPQSISVVIEELAVRIRKELAEEGLDHGPVSVRHRLAVMGLAAPAPSTLARLFTRRGMVTPQPQKRPRSSYRRFEFQMAHECWQIDAFEWLLADDTTCAVFQVLDDHTRYLIASHVATGETAQGAWAAISTGIHRFQVPRLLLSDNGSAFNQERSGRRTQLVTKMLALGCRPITGKPGHPQTQGKDERVHATLQRWLRARPPAKTLDELQALVDTFDHIYNHERPHQSKGMRTPAQALETAPHAVQPEPPEPIPAGLTPQVRMSRRKVSPTGSISVAGRYIQVGHEHLDTHVHVLTSGQSVTIFDTHGEIIRTITLNPGRSYYGNGRPRGPQPKPKRPY